MAEIHAAPAPPEIEVERGIRLDELPSALRGALKAAWRLGMMDAGDYQRTADVPGVAGSTLPHGRALTAAEIEGLQEPCTAGPRPYKPRYLMLAQSELLGGDDPLTPNYHAELASVLF